MLPIILTERDGVAGKVCPGCREWKPAGDYHRSRRLLAGLVSRCKACRAKRTPGWRHDGRSKRPVKDLADRRFGRLLVLAYEGLGEKPGIVYWRCRCDCGTETVKTSKQLLANHCRSCGCLLNELRARSGGRNALPPGESAFRQYFSQYQRSARARGLSFSLDAKEFRVLTSAPCFYCGQEAERPAACVDATNGDYLCNGIDRIDNQRGYEPGNVRPCCKQCNIAKGTLMEAEFLAWLERAAARSARFEHGEKG